MKNRSKMILGLASMLGISAGAAAVSGFAWFTTQRTANMNLGTYKVGAGGGSITLSTDSDCKNINVTNANVTTNACSITPVNGTLADESSKDGTSFKKAILDTAENVASYVAETDGDLTDDAWMSTVNTTQMVCVSWELKVGNSIAGTSIDVYLSNDGAIFKGTQDSDTTDTAETIKATQASQKVFTLGSRAVSITQVKVGASTTFTEAGDSSFTLNKDAAGRITGITLITGAAENEEVTITYKADYSEYYRLAILDSSDELVYLYTNSGADYKNYVGATDVEALAASIDETTMKEITKAGDAGTVDTSTVNATAGNQLLIKNLTSAAPQKLKFVVWCEGTATPKEAVKSNLVTSAFTLVGLTH